MAVVCLGLALAAAEAKEASLESASDENVSALWQRVHFSVAGGTAIPLTSAHRQAFDLGVEVAAAVRFQWLSFLAAGLFVDYLRLPPRPGGPVDGIGTALQLGALVRVSHAFEIRQTSVAPFGELGLGYVRDGDLNRLGLTAAVGAWAVAWGPLRLGPLVRATAILPEFSAGSAQWRDVLVLSLSAGVAIDVWPGASSP